MKVFFNPAYTNFIYQNLEENPLQFDQKVCNTEALIELLEKHAGLHSQVADEIERCLEYCKCMAKYLDENPNSIFAASYKIDTFNTAKQCLAWRDAFILSGWNGEGNTGSKRLNELSEIEKYFKFPSIGDRIKNLITEIKADCLLPAELEIITPFDYNCFNPLLKDLLDSLVERGSKVYTEANLPGGNSFLRKMCDVLVNCKADTFDLRNSDGSVNVWLFEEKNDALQYLSQLEDNSYKVWINRDNKCLDNYLSFAGKPTCGSEDKGVTLLASISFLTLKLLEKPLNLTTLVNYLGLKVSPFSKEFREKLQKAIISSGGYYNDNCKEIISNASTEDLAAVKLFLPDIQDTKTALNENYEYEKGYVETYIKNILLWLEGYLHKERIIPINRAQLEVSKKICGYMISLLNITNKAKFTYQELMLLFENLTADVTMEIYPGEKSCRNLINSSANFAAVSESTVWCDFYNPDEEVLTTTFMYPSEKKYLKDKIWKEELEKEFNRYNNLLPFMYTDKKLTLVIVKKDGTSEVTKNPVIIRLMKNMGMDEKEFYEYLDSPDIRTIDGVSVNASCNINNHSQDERGLVHFQNTNLVKFRQNESFSSISTLIEHPFDYVMEKICGFSMSGEAAMNPVFTTKGTVAHAIIEELFNPKYGGTPSAIKNQIDTRFDEVFDKTILEVGGILLQKENKADTDIFRPLMKECVNRLHKFIEMNNLTVKACEQEHKNESLSVFNACGITFTGFIDMVLDDDSGKPVIFDFKYSSGLKKYEKIIKENRSMQLELYNALIENSSGKKDLNCRRAYILLPNVKVVTSSSFTGSIFKIKVDKLDAKLIDEMKNSYEFRKNQIINGEVEDGEGISITSLEYYQKTNDQKMPLVPLGMNEDDGAKEVNKYSNFAAFKAGKK